MNRSHARYWALFHIAASLAAAACGPAGPALELRLRQASAPLFSPLGGEPAPPDAPPPDIDAFRLCVQDEHGKAMLCRDFTDLGQPSYRLEGVRAGKRRTVTFQGYAAGSDGRQADVKWCGRAVGVRIRKNEVTPVQITLYRCGEFTAGATLLASPRAFHSASLLPDGRVLLAGGFSGFTRSDSACPAPCAVLQATASVEIFDPRTGGVEELLQLNHPRGLHAARTLSDGRVLVAGGCEKASLQAAFSDPDNPGLPLNCLSGGQAAETAEIIDPVAKTASETNIPYSVFSATAALDEERLLLAGGLGLNGMPHRRVLVLQVAAAALWSSEWENGLAEPRAGASAVLLNPAGGMPAQVLLLGGMPAKGRTDPGEFAEILVVGEAGLLGRRPRFVEQAGGVGFPASFSSAWLAAPHLAVAAGGAYGARYLSDDSPFLPRPLQEAVAIELASESLSFLDEAHRPRQARLFPAWTADQMGVLLAGGFEKLAPALPALLQPSRQTESWDGGSEGFSQVWSRGNPVEMLCPRSAASAVRLRDGAVMICGGTDGYTVLNDCEFFSPFSASLGEGGLH